MSVPKKHHFVPSFYLASWTGADDQLCQMRKVNGTITPIRRPPRSTGFEEHLYRTEGVGEEHQQHLELKFFSPLDNDAALALQKLEAQDLSPWAGELRNGWTRFLLSLRFRNPETVKDLKSHMANVWVNAADSIKKNFENWRSAADPETFEEFEKLLNPAAPSIGATNLVMKIIDNDKVGPAISNMTWSMLRVQNSAFSLLTSDRPLVWQEGLANPNAQIVLPIGPHAIFLASNNPKARESKVWNDHTKVVEHLNRLTVSQAKEYAWGADDKQLGFVRKHLGSAQRGSGSAITPEQKEASLRSARGEKLSGVSL